MDAPTLVQTSDMATDLDRQAGSGVGGLDSAIMGVKKAAKDASAKVEGYQEDIGKIISSMPDSASIPKPKAPQSPDFKPPQGQDPYSFFGSFAGTLGLIASAITKRPLTASLNAAAAGMNAVKAGNKEAYDEALETWKANTDFAFKQADWEQKNYQSALDLMRTDYAKGEARIRTIAQMAQDQPVLMLLKQGSPDKVASLLEERQRLNIAGQEAQEKLWDGAQKQKMLLADPDYANALKKQSAGQQLTADEAEKMRAAYQRVIQAGSVASGSLSGMKASAVREYMTNHPGTTMSQAMAGIAAEEELAKVAGKGVALSEDGVALAAEKYLMLGSLDYLGMGVNANRTAIINKAAEMAKAAGLTPDQLMAARAEVKSDVASLSNVTKIADSMTAYENTALDNMKVVLSKMPAGIGPTAIPFIDNWVLTGEAELGDKDVPPYATALITVANEYAKVISGASGAQGATVDSRREAAEMLKRGFNEGQIVGTFDTMKQDMDNKKVEYNTQRNVIKDRISDSVKPKATTSSTSNNGWSVEKVQ